MKKQLLYTLICFYLLLISNSVCLAEKKLTEVKINPDTIEQATGLKKISGERYVLDLKYNSDDNFLKHNIYARFGVDECYLHPEAYAKIMALEPLLIEKQLKLVIFDCYRPLEVQEAMWTILPDSRYVANPKRGSLHNRGVAIDCALADENGKYLEFPTTFDSFEKKAWHSYECKPEELKKCNNRELLKTIMVQVGLSPISTEWWHYQLKEPKKYPLISITGIKK